MNYSNQHIIPQVYLKHFAENKCVYIIALSNKYNRAIQHKGIGDKVFCNYEKRYYDFPNYNNEPILEKYFSKRENTDYETIISRIDSRHNLSIETKFLIIDWILMMKTRSAFFRDRISKNISWIEEIKYRLINGNDKLTEIDFIKNGKENGKAIQLSSFLEYNDYIEIQKEYSINFLNREWEILTTENDEFITNDNPGFSISISYDIYRLGLSPVSSIFNLDNSIYSIHYFPLTSNKCLCLSPIRKGKSLEINSDIKFQNASSEEVTIINHNTILTSYKLIISKSQNILINYRDIIKSKFK